MKIVYIVPHLPTGCMPEYLKPKNIFYPNR